MIEKKADLNVKNIKNQTVFDILLNKKTESMDLECSKKNLTSCFTYLFSLEHFQSFKEDDPVYNFNTVAYFIKNQVDELFAAALKKYPRDQLEFVPENQFNMLFLTVIESQCEKLLLVLNAGACIDTQTKKGNTPLMALIKIKEHPERMKMIEILLENKAAVDKQNLENKTALDLVRESEDEELIQCFEKYGFEVSTGKNLN